MGVYIPLYSSHDTYRVSLKYTLLNIPAEKNYDLTN